MNISLKQSDIGFSQSGQRCITLSSVLLTSTHENPVDTLGAFLTEVYFVKYVYKVEVRIFIVNLNITIYVIKTKAICTWQPCLTYVDIAQQVIIRGNSKLTFSKSFFFFSEQVAAGKCFFIREQHTQSLFRGVRFVINVCWNIDVHNSC